MEISPVDEEEKRLLRGGIPLIYPATELLRRLGFGRGWTGKSVRIRARQWVAASAESDRMGICARQ